MIDKRGAYVTIDGPEGTGKTTQVMLLGEKTGSQIVREPGGTVIGSHIRSILLSVDNIGLLNPRTELLLFMADRSELSDVIEKTINHPAGWRSVISDRSAVSTVAYQQYGREIGFTTDMIMRLAAFAMNGLRPDLRIVLDVPVETTRERIGARALGVDRFESEDDGFHQRVRDGYLQFAKEMGAVVIDASGTKDEVTAQLYSVCGEMLIEGIDRD